MTLTIDLTLPDRDNYEQDELDIVYSIKPRRVLALVFHADRGMAVQIGTMCREGSVREVYLRPWASDIGHEPPEQWAQICFERGERVRAELPEDTVLHMIPGNEMNLDLEGYDGDMPRLIQWLEDFGKAWTKIKGHQRYILHLPAPWSGWVGEADKEAIRYWNAARDKGLKRYYKAIDCHAYAGGFDLWRQCAAIWLQQPHITEYNRVDPRTVLAALDPNQAVPAAAAFYFTARWACYEHCTEDGWRQDDAFSLLRYPELREEIRAANADERSKEEPVSGIVHAFDVASYQHTTLRGLIQTYHPDHVICRQYLEIEAPSQDVTRDLVRVSREEGCTVGGYFWAYRSASPEQSIDDVIALCASMNLVLPICWIDCETYGAGASFDPGPDADWLRRARAQAALYEMPLGIYTGLWWILEHFPGGLAAWQEFADMPLWIANYGQAPSLDWTPIPGVPLAGHQYTSDPVDRSLMRKEFTMVAGGEPTPEPDPCAELKARLTAIYHEIGELVGVTG